MKKQPALRFSKCRLLFHRKYSLPRSIIQSAHHAPDGGDAVAQGGFVLGDAHADTFAGVPQAVRVHAHEEMLARNDERAFRFQLFIQFLR